MAWTTCRTGTLHVWKVLELSRNIMGRIKIFVKNFSAPTVFSNVVPENKTLTVKFKIRRNMKYCICLSQFPVFANRVPRFGANVTGNLFEDAGWYYRNKLYSGFWDVLSIFELRWYHESFWCSHRKVISKRFRAFVSEILWYIQKVCHFLSFLFHCTENYRRANLWFFKNI